MSFNGIEAPMIQTWIIPYRYIHTIYYIPYTIYYLLHTTKAYTDFDNSETASPVEILQISCTPKAPSCGSVTMGMLLGQKDVLEWLTEAIRA